MEGRSEKKNPNYFPEVKFKTAILKNLNQIPTNISVKCPNTAKTRRIKYVLYLSSDLHFTD